MHYFSGIGGSVIWQALYNVCSHWSATKDLGLMLALVLSGLQLGQFLNMLLAGKCLKFCPNVIVNIFLQVFSVLELVGSLYSIFGVVLRSFLPFYGLPFSRLTHQKVHSFLPKRKYFLQQIKLTKVFIF